MRVSYRWLLDYVDTDLSPGELASELERIGIETEELEQFGEGLGSVVVGEILSIAPHPSASKLKVAEVGIGSEALRVVCGAPNVKANTKGVLALPGTVLPGGTRVGVSEIRGVKSQGMLLSELELGLSDDHSGIIILPKKMVPGSQVAPYYELDDSVFDFEITPNRPDLLSVIGLAREVSTVTKRKLKIPRVSVSESDDDTGDRAEIEVRDPEGCPRYMARVVDRVKTGRSPRWLAGRLKRCGLGEVNNVVDATNYVMLEFGHPLHPFDLDRLEGRRIVVRRAKGSEAMTTLDGEEKNLTDEVLVIADGRKPVAIAGIVGGAESGVDPDTTQVLLESAFFDPVRIRTTSRMLGIETEASIRFEKKADIEALPVALDRAAQLISRLARGKICKGSLDFYPNQVTRPKVTLRKERLNRLLGIEMSKKEIYSSLQGLHIKPDRNLSSSIPAFRRDLVEEVDLIEEAARIYGYERIPSSSHWNGSLVGSRNRRGELIFQLKRRLCGLGYNEVCGLSFVDTEEVETRGYIDGRKLVRVCNPLSERWNGLRHSLIPSVAEIAITNLKRDRESVRIFEVGRIFINDEDGFREEEHLACLSTGDLAFWDESEYRADFYGLKGDIESLLDSIQPGDIAFSSTDYPYLRPGTAADLLLDGERFGVIGELILAHKTTKKTYVAELNLKRLLEPMLRERLYERISRYPIVERDLALLVEDRLPAHDVCSVIEEEGGKYLESVRLFDLYTGEKIPAGKKSLTYRMRFRAKDKTLRDEDVDRDVNRVLSVLRKRLNVILRGGSVGTARV